MERTAEIEKHALASRYVALIGYDPFADDPAITGDYRRGSRADPHGVRGRAGGGARRMIELNDVHICHVLRVNGDKRETVLTFIVPMDFGTASYLAGQAADAWTDTTGHEMQWFVEPLPYIRPTDEGRLPAWVREQAADYEERTG